MADRRITDLMRFEYRELFDLNNTIGTIADNQQIKSAITNASIIEMKDCHGKHYAVTVNSNEYDSVKNTLIALDAEPLEKKTKKITKISEQTIQDFNDILDRLDPDYDESFDWLFTK